MDRRTRIALILVSLAVGGYALLRIPRTAEAAPWWSGDGTNWAQRKQLTVTNNSASSLSSSTTVSITINTKELYDAGKLQSDCDDLRILYQPSNTTAVEVTRHLVYPSSTTCATSTATKVFFPLQAALSSAASSTDYLMYYGYSAASTPSSTDNAFDISSIDATLVCPFDGSTTCAAGETPSTESGAVRYGGSKVGLQFPGFNTASNTSMTVVSAGLLTGSNQFTLEGWYYVRSITTFATFLGEIGGSSGINHVSGSLIGRAVIGGSSVATGSAAVTTNTWTHIALSYDGSTLRLFLNGAVAASASATGTLTQANAWRLGSDQASSGFNGIADEVRVSNIARYTAAFTPSTKPHVRDSNTVILLHLDENGDDPRNTGKAIDDSGNGNHATIPSGVKGVSGLVGVASGTTDTGNVPRQGYAAHEGIFIEEGTTNKITNPSFDHTTYNTHWDAAGANLTPTENTTAPYYTFGSKSRKLVASASAISGTSNMDTIGIDPDSTATHTLSFYAYDGTTGNVGGTVSSSIVKPVWEGIAQSGGTYTDVGGGWWRVTYAAAITDSTNEYGVEVQVSKTVYIDGVQLEALAYATTYTDGTLGTGYAWSGTAHGSTSTRTEATVVYTDGGNVSNRPATLSFWAKIPEASAMDSSTKTLVSAASNEKIAFTSASDITATCGANSVNSASAGLTAGAWNHIVLVWDSFLTLYVNGSSKATNGISTNCFTGSFIRIGGLYGGAELSNSTISDLRVYSDDFTSTQVTDLYQAGLVGHSQGSQIDRFGGSATSGDDPISVWHFDEGNGQTTSDATLRSNTLTLGGGSSSDAADPVWSVDGNTANPRRASLSFDGTNDYIYRETDGDFNPGTGSFSISGWFKHPSTQSGTDTLLSRFGSAGYQIYMNSSGYLCFGTDDDSTWSPDDSACSTTSYADSNWHHFEVVKNGTTSLTTYVDGVSVGTDSSIAATGTLNTGSRVYIGSDNTPANHWTGNIDDLVYYDYARSAAQVKSDAQGAGTGTTLGANAEEDPLTQGLVGYWKMDESAANSCSGGSNDSCDSSGNTNDAVWTNDVASASGKFGNGVTLDGTGDNVRDATPVPGSFTGSKSISAWIYADNFTNSPVVVSMGSGGILYLDTSGRPVGQNNGGQNTTASTAMSTATWTHLAYTYNDTTDRKVHLFINGVEVSYSSQPAVSGAITNTIQYYEWGSHNNGTQYFDGKLDEARIYNRALSPAEVQQLYSFAPGPVGYWKLDETSTGTSAVSRADSSGNGYTLSDANTTPSAQGKYGTAAQFSSASSEYLSIADNAALSSGDRNFTLEAWVKPASLAGSTKYITAKLTSGGTVGYALRQRTDHTFQFITFTTGGVTQGSAFGGTVTANAWTHLSGIHNTDTNTVTLYVNGIPVSSTSTSGDLVDEAATFSIGRSDQAGYFDGTIDEVKFYNYARTASQIIEDMNGGHPLGGSPVGSQVAYWKLDEGNSTTAQDSSTNDNDLTLSAAGWTNSGKFSKAWDGDGIKYVSRADDADFDVSATDDYAISLWFKSDSASNPGTTEYLFNKANATTAGYAVYANTDGTLCFAIDDDTTWSPDIASCSTTDFYDGTWHHLLGIRDATGTDKTYLYIDGVQRDSDSDTTSATLANSLSLYIGDRDGTNNGDEFNGDIDEVKVYRASLSLEQIKIDYTQGSATVFGASSTASDGTTADNSAAREYCVPGDTSSCSAPVAEWKMDEGTGSSTADASGNANTGTLTNGPSWKDAGSCKYANCVSFDGSDDYVTFGNNALNSELSGASAATFSAWIKPTSINTGAFENSFFEIINNTGGNSGVWANIDQTDSNKLLVGGRSASGDSFQTGKSTSAISQNSWTHVAGILDFASDQIRIYVNGALETTQSVTFSSSTYTPGSTPTVADTIGGRDTYEYAGIVDTLRLYAYARTPAQIAWEYNRGAPVAHWKLDECTGTTAYNSAPNGNGGFVGNNGTITIGSSGTQTATGTCGSGNSAHAWSNGATGKFSSSLNFDGTDDYVSMGDIALLEPALNQGISISGWAKSANWPTGIELIAGKHCASCNHTVYIAAYQDKARALVSGTGGSKATNSSENLTNGQWAHIVMTWTGVGTDPVVLYVNGSNTGSVEANSTITAISGNTEPTLIGAREGGTASLFSGQIDDVRYYNYALTPVQVKTLMNEGSAVRFGPQTGSP